MLSSLLKKDHKKLQLTRNRENIKKIIAYLSEEKEREKIGKNPIKHLEAEFHLLYSNNSIC